MRVLMLVMLCVSAPAMAADQFDLACQGTKITKHDGPAAPYSFHVRVDLAAKKWCADACERVAAISDIKPDRVVLADDLIYNTSSDFSNSVYFDSRTFDYHQLSSQDRPTSSYLKVAATCTQQPFTPLPAPKS